MHSSVSNRQMFFLLLLTLTAYTVISIPNVISQTSGTGGWLSLMITALLFAVFAVILVRLNSAFPGMTLLNTANASSEGSWSMSLRFTLFCIF